MPLRATLGVSLNTTTTPITSYNVAGLLKGSDPALAQEVVVLSGHLDHIGVGKPDAAGDTINNGALDDAVGIASLIEEAKRFKTAATPPRRSILFLAVTAEEKGLIGSDYFAHNPTVPIQSIVADVNLDMPIITYKFQDVVVYGAQHSTLGPIVQKGGRGDRRDTVRGSAARRGHLRPLGPLSLRPAGRALGLPVAGRRRSRPRRDRCVHEEPLSPAVRRARPDAGDRLGIGRALRRRQLPHRPRDRRWRPAALVEQGRFLRPALQRPGREVREIR
jgi:hypothetical protein